MTSTAPLSSPELALDARGIARRFGARWVLRGVNLQVKAGEMVGLLGHNGCGKSTFMRIVATLLKASAGDCFVYGANIDSLLPGATQDGTAAPGRDVHAHAPKDGSPARRGISD